jgi:choline dehydrogenase-like flavoprotein
MESVLIVGSGASGVHFALSLLKKGYHVIMLDVGWQKPVPVNPSDQWTHFKENLEDPVRYFLGQNFESIVFPEAGGEYYTKYYGFPPSKSHVFSQPNNYHYTATGFVPLMSFAQGGLAEAWTGGAYAFNEHDLKEYPFSYSEIEPFYSEVARRIGLIGVDDDMAQFFPLHGNLLPPLQLDLNSQYLVQAYQKHKQAINVNLGGYLGRSRVTTQSMDTEERKGCWYCGRCLWGCPTESLYTPSITLRECKQYPNFEYQPGMLVSHFRYSLDHRVTGVVAESIHDRSVHEFTSDRYALAAGSLSSAKIFMDSIYRETGEIIKLSGLMDNRQILVPFLNLKMIGKPYNPNSYQYHQLAIGLVSNARPEEYIHGQITTLKTALVHPVIQNLPTDIHTGSVIFRNTRSGLGVVNLNLCDRRRESNHVTLQPDSQEIGTELVIKYTATQEEKAIIENAIKRTKKLLWKLNSIVPPGMVHVRPMGASVHYSGVLPMSGEKKPFHTDRNCRSYDFENLYIVDGSTMPFLPAKNITFTLMANAVRVAESVF